MTDVGFSQALRVQPKMQIQLIELIFTSKQNCVSSSIIILIPWPSRPHKNSNERIIITFMYCNYSVWVVSSPAFRVLQGGNCASCHSSTIMHYYRATQRNPALKKNKTKKQTWARAIAQSGSICHKVSSPEVSFPKTPCAGRRDRIDSYKLFPDLQKHSVAHRGIYTTIQNK